jgi:hypothetical protein
MAKATRTVSKLVLLVAMGLAAPSLAQPAPGGAPAQLSPEKRA